MSCATPLRAWRTRDGGVQVIGKGSSGPVDGISQFLLPCGKCIMCRLRYSHEWAVRCMHENQMHEVSSFVTLTYRDEDLPLQGQLVHRHFQLFMKRLRFLHGSPIRYYMCGEYGDASWRPHYHAVLFGVFFNDREYWKMGDGGFPVYASKYLSEVWSHGDCYVGDVTYESAAYVARYVTKKVTGDLADSHYERVDPWTGEIFKLEPEYCRMSLKPGIGATWFDKYQAEILARTSVRVNNSDMGIPRAYKRMLELQDPEKFASLQDELARRAMLYGEDDFARLRVEAEVTRARCSKYKRTLE